MSYIDTIIIYTTSCLVCCHKLSINELVHVAMGTNYPQDFDLNIYLDSINVDNVAPPTLKFHETKCHASLLSSFYEETLYIMVLEKLLILKSE